MRRALGRPARELRAGAPGLAAEHWAQGRPPRGGGPAGSIQGKISSSCTATPAVQAVQRVHSHNQSATVRDILEWNTHFLMAFESFFGQEGASLAEAPRLSGLARRSLAERAYWCAVSNLARGGAWSQSRALWRQAIDLKPRMVVLPPLGYLWRRTDVLRRPTQPVLDRLGRLRLAARWAPNG